MIGNIGSNFPAYSMPKTQSNKAQSLPRLSQRETEILNEIQSMVGSSVEINMGQQSECGRFTLAFVGFGGWSAFCPRPPFNVTPSMLAEMAEDKGNFDMWMQRIREKVERQEVLESGFNQGQSDISSLIRDAIQKHSTQRRDLHDWI